MVGVDTNTGTNGPRARRSPTIGDVARLAGVSPTTVSFVLNGVGSRISERTTQRVRSAVRELGYRPNATAKYLRTSRSDTIGFITDEIASTPHAGGIILGAQDAAWESGKLLMIVNTGANREIDELAVEAMLERRVEGIIYAAMYHRDVKPPEASGEVPLILLDCYSEDGRWTSVVPDEVAGGRTATEILLDRGHERVGFVNLSPGLAATAGRLEGYRRAIEDRGLTFDVALVRHGDGRASGGYRETQQLMRLVEPPTALFCGNDQTAMGAYEALKELGLRIPEDVAVVGFDNDDLIAPQLRPPLSTVALPHYEMGRWAVNYLIGHYGSHEMPVIHEALDCTYVERESV
jgi:LacI family transcriptional regulator